MIKIDSPSRQELLERSLLHPNGVPGAGAGEPAGVDAGSGTGADRGSAVSGSAVLDVDTWAMSPERDAFRERRSALALALGTALVLTVLAWAMLKPPEADSSEWWGRFALFLAGVLVLLAMVPYWSSRRAYRQRRLATAATRVDRAIQRLAEPDETGQNRLPLARLFELNRRQLDEYQEMTKKQQRSAFLLAQAASVAAFLALLTGVLLSFQVDTASERYVVTGLSGLGALLSGFLAKTFFESHRSANEQLNHYYLEPQRTGRILAAERLARYLEDPGKEYVPAMITQLLRWEMPSVNGTSPETSDGPGEEEE